MSEHFKSEVGLTMTRPDKLHMMMMYPEQPTRIDLRIAGKYHESVSDADKIADIVGSTILAAMNEFPETEMEILDRSISAVLSKLTDIIRIKGSKAHKEIPLTLEKMGRVKFIQYLRVKYNYLTTPMSDDELIELETQMNEL